MTLLLLYCQCLVQSALVHLVLKHPFAFMDALIILAWEIKTQDGLPVKFLLM